MYIYIIIQGFIRSAKMTQMSCMDATGVTAIVSHPNPIHGNISIYIFFWRGTMLYFISIMS